MFIVLPYWEIFARIGENDNRAMPAWLKLQCADDDFEAVMRTLKRSGYYRFEIARKMPGEDIAQTVED